MAKSPMPKAAGNGLVQLDTLALEVLPIDSPKKQSHRKTPKHP
jgi:hypothetical protein